MLIKNNQTNIKITNNKYEKKEHIKETKETKQKKIQIHNKEQKEI